MSVQKKIYTKKGDKGMTCLIGNAQVVKYDLRVEAYGALDELNSYLGLLSDLGLPKDTIKTLRRIQKQVYTISSAVASDSKHKNLFKVKKEEILFLENEIDKLSKNLLPLNHFLIPGGHIIVSHCHVARSVSRRAERRVINAAKTFKLSPEILAYLNRLSDYLFVLSRALSKQLKVKEVYFK